MNLKAMWREPSTKRGAVMLVTGGAVLYQTLFGNGVADVAGLETSIERWIGVGMMLAGLLGWLPDTPKEPPRDLPPIELVSRPAVGAEPVELRRPMPPDYSPKQPQHPKNYSDSWNS